MFDDLSDLRETLYAARLLREQILVFPVRPDDRARLSAEFLAENGRGRGGPAALELAARPLPPSITREHLASLASACGGRGPRRGPGDAFQGRAAPPPSGVDALVSELLETVNSPVAVESWPPAVRAFALHFFLRLVQPFEAPGAVVGALAEAWLLAADGIAPQRFLLPEASVGGEAPSPRPDPEAFVRDRAHRLVERLSESEERVRAAVARAVVRGWAEEPAARLNSRQERLLLWLCAGDGTRTMGFAEYVRLHAGRRAPSLRSLQRDWKGLREAGWLEDLGDGRFRLRTRGLEFGA